MSELITLDTAQRREVIDITDDLARIAAAHPRAAALLVASQHTTAAITVNEGWDPDAADDLLRALGPLADRDDYRHAEGNSDAHVQVALIGASQVVPCADGKLVLGRWQRVFFCEFDGPRRDRNVVVTPLAGA